MDIHVTFSGARGRSAQVYRQIRTAILDGRLRAGEPLPTSRELAERLQIARNTVLVAYDQLAGEGFVTGKVGAGTFVSGTLPTRRDDGSGWGFAVGVLRPRALWDGFGDPPDLSAAAPPFDFRPGLPDARLFPYQTWRGLMSRELRASAVGTGHYGDPAGHPVLRAAIARHVGVSRGVRADPADVVITNGIQQAIDLIGRVLLDQGACAAVEDPGYPPPRLLLQSLGAQVVTVPVDDEGLVIDALPDDTRLVYVHPSHQFPLGLAMSLRRRMALLAWAARRGAAIIEDDYDSEFRFTGHLNALDRAASAGVSLFPLSDFTVGEAQPGLVIGYGAIPLERIDEGLHRLKACLGH